jgi:hypothetical protein
MKTVRMLTDAVGGEGEPLKAGETYELNDASADRWLRRGKAELVDAAAQTRRDAVRLGAGEGAGGNGDGDADQDKGGAKPSEGLTVAEIKEALAAKKVDIPDGVTLKADLAALLDAAE